MNDLISKVASYNIFNYLFPGIIFSILLTETTTYYLIIDNLLIAFFVYYFIGLIISRIGSIVIEPILKKTQFIQFAAYDDFVKASMQDGKIDILSETNNMYRTLLSMFPVLLIVIGWSKLKEVWHLLDEIELYLISVLLILFFLFSYRKQTSFIRKRVLAVLEKQS